MSKWWIIENGFIKCEQINKLPTELIICSRIYSNLQEKGAINLSKIDAHITYWVLSI